MRASSVVAVASLVALCAMPPAESSIALSNVAGSTLALGVAIPDKLAAGTSATSTFGVNATSAVTSVKLGTSAKSFPSLLTLTSTSASAQQATLSFRSATGLAEVASATFTLGATIAVVVSNGVVTQSSGVPVNLSAGGSLTLGGWNMATTTKSSTPSLVFNVVTNSTAAPGARATLTWTVVAT